MNYMETYQEWINNNTLDEHTKNELLKIQNNDDELKERFIKDLGFGTGGLRGIIGAGTNRINKYTVRKATQGLANYIKKSCDKKSNMSVAIAYDSRHFSDLFAKEAALVLAANNIKAYLFDDLRPTPELSFTVRHLGCDAGIVITASHNPSEYNGYKVYGSDGGQITLETANSIIYEINKLDLFNDVITCSKEDAMSKKLLVYIGDEIDKEYLENITKLSINPKISKEVDDFKIVYTPLHGTGLMPISKSLEMLGYKEVHIVESQKEPNGDFPTVKSPNPEEREALRDAIAFAEEISADIVLGTDPDTDRVGVAVRSEKGNYELLTGNQIGALLTHYLVSNKKDITSKDAVIKTIVTSELGANIAKSYGATVFDTLTGFKFIGEKINEFEETGEYDFLFGYEESYGYLAGTFVRDKDAVISSVLIVEMAAYYKKNNMTLIHVLESIYNEYGYYLDHLESYTFKGLEGQEKIDNIINIFRNRDTLLEKFNGINIIEDYSKQTKFLLKNQKLEIIELPKADVIKVYFDDKSWFAVRPSGTEPKFKIYYSVIAKSSEQAQEKFKLLNEKVCELVNEFRYCKRGG